jgi:hypothetical protein
VKLKAVFPSAQESTESSNTTIEDEDVKGRLEAKSGKALIHRATSITAKLVHFKLGRRFIPKEILFCFVL